MSAFNRTIKLTVISDVICPNCNIGQHELIGAISYCQDTLKLPLTFEIEFLPFRLIPTRVLPDDVPGPKQSKEEFFSKAVGKDSYALMEASVAKWSQERNIPMSFNGVVSQSTRAHRLSRKAYHLGGQNKQLPYICAVYRAYLEEAKDIEDIDVLAEISEECGVLSKQEAIDFLKSDELLDEVNNMCANLKENIAGIPWTIIDNKWCIKGGQASEVFVQIFKKLAYTSVSAAPSPFSAPIVEMTSLTA